MRKSSRLVMSLIVVLLFGCGPRPPAPPEPGGPKGGGEPVRLHIPDHKGPVPAGVLDQLSWGGKGGGEVEIEQKCGNCRVKLKGDHISLTNFQPAQELQILIYRLREQENCDIRPAEYVTLLPIRVDERGNFSTDLSGPTRDLVVATVLDAPTRNEIWTNPSVTYQQPNCPKP